MKTELIGERLIRCLCEKELTLATAESLTGGLISKLITDVSGASAVFKGGVCSYSNDVKMDILSVQADTIADFGAVSEQTAKQMCKGVRKLLGADIAISATGAAGPAPLEGYEPGLVFICVCNKHSSRTKRLKLPKGLTRKQIRNITAEEAIKLASEFIKIGL